MIIASIKKIDLSRKLLQNYHIKSFQALFLYAANQLSYQKHTNFNSLKSISNTEFK